jgi:hypothetical protein
MTGVHVDLVATVLVDDVGVRPAIGDQLGRRRQDQVVAVATKCMCL